MSPPLTSSTDRVALRAAVLAWGRHTCRDLPWRRTRDGWAVLVSETMLQQTQVARVVPHYLSFLERFPTPMSCAAAPVADVVRLWSGLGYNRRAVQLHRAAQAVSHHHDGRVPDDLDALLALPGVGPYTARAVLAFAHEHDVGVLDTNVGRVLARLGGCRLRPKEAQAAADALVPAGRAWAWNQSMLDLGAEVCRARAPRCRECPVAAWCAWRGDGDDPARGSAGVSGGQARFEGSDRQGRGRLLRALQVGPVGDGQLAATMGWPDDPQRAERVAASLVVDGLATRGEAGSYRLP